MPELNAFLLYEQIKQSLIAQNLPDQLYQEKLANLAQELGI